MRKDPEPLKFCESATVQNGEQNSGLILSIIFVSHIQLNDYLQITHNEMEYHHTFCQFYFSIISAL